MTELKVSLVMTRLLETASPEEPLLSVVKRMAQSSISCLIVVEDERPVGIVTERDVVKLYAENSGRGTGLCVGDFMTQPVHSIAESLALSEAGRLMKRRRCRRFPVVGEDGKLTGLVTQTDILDGTSHALERYSRKLEKMVEGRTEELRRKNEELEGLSVTDSLTGLYNRRFLYQRFEEELARATRHCTPLGCLMIDVDHFKAVNDRFGHGVGDGALKDIGDILRAEVRKDDFVARYGGEEFVIVCHEDATGAMILGERIRAIVEGHIFGGEEGSFSLTMSCGVTAQRPTSGCDNVDHILRMADSALYQAKEKGRNRVELFQGALMPVTSQEI